MVGYSPQTLQKVEFLEFSQLKPCLLDSLSRNMAEMILKSHQHPAERKLSCKVIY